MSHRKLIWKAFKQAGILDSQDPNVKKFVQYLKDSPASCWEEVIPEFRSRFYDCFDAIVPTLAGINDPLIQMVLANHADASRPKEAALLENMAKTVDPDKSPVVLKRIAGYNIPSVRRELKKRTLPESLTRYVKR